MSPEKGAFMPGYLFALTSAVILPVAAAVFMALRYKHIRAVLMGAACFIVFQVLTRIPLLQVVLPRWTEYILFQFSRPVLYLIFLSLTAGLFEEIGRFITMRWFLKEMPLTGAVAFGVGHGGIEALLLAGINFIAIGITGAMPINEITSPQFFMGGIERIFAMTVHVCLSVMVWRSLREGKVSLLVIAVVLHTLLNVIGTYLMYLGMSAAVIEASIGLFAGLLLLYTIFTVRGNQGGIQS